MHLQLQNGGIPKKDDAKPQQTEKLDTSESETSEEDAEAEEVLQNVVVPKKVDAKSQQTQKMDTSESETSEENAEVEEVEAEEEILPMMVAPGHIRFERDEGNCAFIDPLSADCKFVECNFGLYTDLFSATV